uniref:peroxisome proliferator-activated receptor gamma coactivator 1-beta n=1 Tax=Euleptes europaea TaxID=460621 RepID=UPI00254169B6|nr:peroxisome proliferator-activated receptor gamma coactivator 1-beta [Euleptes europaea]
MAEPGPDCSALLDEELSSFVFNYLTDSQYEVSGEEHLYSDFPEIDLSQLDASDFDSANCFSELQWCCERSETESSQHSTDDSELFQIIDSENEALLAALTETLDDIQGDDMGLAAFRNMDEGDMPSSGYTSPTPSPKPAAPASRGLPLAPEVDELSLLKKLLLSPSNVPASYEIPKEGNVWRPGVPRSRSQRPCTKAEGVCDRKSSFLQPQSRSCTELHKHLTSTTTTTHCPHTKSSWPPDECHGSSHTSELQGHYAPGGEDSDSSEDLPSFGNIVATPPSSSEEGSGEKELHAAVELIRYMHTYCLPPRKLPPTGLADVKHQHYHSPSKRAKPDCPLQRPALCGKDTRSSGSWRSSEGCKRSRAASSDSSILKELLARDLAYDVSKPYRLAKPVYASLARSQPPKSPRPPPLETGQAAEMSKAVAKMPPEAKTGLRQSAPTEPEAKKETGSPAEEDGAKRGILLGQLASGKAARKPESSVYAVRRSKRLNPELSLWLSFLEETPSDAAISTESAGEGARQPFPPTAPLQDFDTEAPAAEVEVNDVDVVESECQSHPMELQTPSPESSGESEAYEINGIPCGTLLHQTEAARRLSLPLAQIDPTSGKQNFEQMLTVELCGTAGLTPPTTPPYKPSEEDLYKPDIRQRPAKETAIVTSSELQPATGNSANSRKNQKKHPVRTELYAHLSRAAAHPSHLEHHGMLKRPFSRSFGDHDYCQVLKSEASLQRKVLKSWEPMSHVESQHKRRGPDVHYQGASEEGACEASAKEGSKQLRDQEIRASLTKHFGLLDSALDDRDMAFCKTPEYDTVFEDSCSELGSPVEEEEEEEEECCSSPLESKMCPYKNPLSRASLHYCSRSRSGSESSCGRSRSPASRWAFRCENGKQYQDGTVSNPGQMEKRREKAIGEGRVVFIKNLSSSMSSSELKQRFEVFGEIVECCVLTRNKREDKYGFITYRCSEHAALSVKNGASLRKRNEPSFQLSYGGFGHFFWTRYTDVDSNTEESSPAPVKSKYETMDFDSLLQEAQESLHR